MRVKRGVTKRARHNKIRKATKGMTLSNRSSVRRGKQAVIKAMENAHRDRREKKRTFRQLWNARINAAARQNGTTYSQLIHGMSTQNITINRKMLAEIAVSDEAAFKAIIAAATTTGSPAKSTAASSKPAAKPAAKATASKTVDLTIVEGIGPKISDILVAAGIDSFQKLADTSADDVRTVLEAAGPRYNSHDPSTWAEQAQLAADGKFDELEALKDRLDGGKR